MPRKNSASAPGGALRAGASMRPRPDAAEKPDLLAEVARHRMLASMRPRPDAAEKHGGAARLARRDVPLQ